MQLPLLMKTNVYKYNVSQAMNVLITFCSTIIPFYYVLFKAFPHNLAALLDFGRCHRTISKAYGVLDFFFASFDGEASKSSCFKPFISKCAHKCYL